jgi:tRNA(fMet)-specific endonuclease VapC
VADGLILETTFLIDLERARRRGTGPPLEFLQHHPLEGMYVTFTAAGELAAGIGPDGRRDWEAFLAPFHVLSATPDVCWQYGTLYSYLRRSGQMIGTNDLWIAATALDAGMPLVTRNISEFERVPGLTVLRYD